MGITPIQHPITVPIAGKAMARSTKFRVLHEVKMETMNTEKNNVREFSKEPDPRPTPDNRCRIIIKCRNTQNQSWGIDRGDRY